MAETFLKIRCFFFKICLFFHRERQSHRQREKQAPCGDCDVELYRRTLGSHPEPKADAQLLSHPGAPKIDIKNKITRILSILEDCVHAQGSILSEEI